ncbi:NAD(P)H-quinone oxidoreductase subunit 3 [subsurface metagenome]
MLANYGYVGLFLVVAIALAFIIIILPVLLSLYRISPHNPSAAKNATYECGLETIGKTWVQFNFRYYFYALIFVALDVLVVLLYPWAVSLRQLGGYGLGAMLIILAIIMVGYIYAWNKKVLEWK